MINYVFPLGVSSVLVCCAFSQEVKPVYDLVARVTPDAVKQVEFELDKSFEGFSFENKQGKLRVRGSSVNNLVAGYGYFLREYEGAIFSWNGNRLPARITPSLVKDVVKVKQEWKWRYAYNYCTLSYSSAFWGQKEWERELDFMALNGVNLALVQAGLERVWQLTLREIGYPEEKIKAFIPNPSAAAWWNMGNLEGHSGPISQNIIDQEARLGRFITGRMKDLGISPVLQGFIGLVPHDLEEHYTKDGAEYIEQGKWVWQFVRPSFLAPSSKAFSDIAGIWYKNLKAVYGVEALFFGGDLFHEGGNSKGINVTEASRLVQQSMQKASPKSSWVLQAWGGNPSGALLDGLEKDKALVLYLSNDRVNGAKGERLKGYKGVPWVWCEVINFGGKHHLYGSLKQMAELGTLQSSPDKDNLQGLGIMSEGSGTNPICYEFFFQRFWMDKNKVMDDAALYAWLKNYAQRRYGKAPAYVVEALKKLEGSVYRPAEGMTDGIESILCARPHRNVQKACTWAQTTKYYDTAEVIAAAEGYVKAAQEMPELLKQETFDYDLIDIVRQITADLAQPLLASIMFAYDSGDMKEYEKRTNQFLSMMSDLDSLLATHSQWRFGQMYEQAEAKGTTPEEKSNMRMAAKRLVTTWSGKIDALNDYAHRQLSGLMKDYYRKRWELFFDTYRKALKGEVKNNEVDKIFLDAVHAFELAWENEEGTYSSVPEGDVLSQASQMVEKYGKIARELSSFDEETKGTKWPLKDGATTLTFDVSEKMVEPGTYNALFQWEKGSSALEISKVELFAGDKLIAEDVHIGRTGLVNSQNGYKIVVPKLEGNLSSYVIKAHVKGVSSSTDSEGKFIFRKAD